MISESKIILPVTDNDGVALDAAISLIEDMLLHHFGGFNVSESRGSWRDSNSGKVYVDKCLTYVIASEWGLADNASILRQIAIEAARRMSQECIYICIDGSVEFVTQH